MHTLCRQVAGFVLIALLAGCGSGDALVSKPPSRFPNPPLKGAATQYLYVGNTTTNTVTVYDFYAGTLVRTITNGVNTPNALAVDATGNLYSANDFNPGNVTEYDNSGTLIRTIANGISNPDALALDSAGTLYVGNGASITVYPPGATAPSVTIAAGVGAPSAIAVDGAGTVYSANQTLNTISEYAAGSVSPTRTITGMFDPPGLAVSATGVLVAASCYSCSGQSGTDAVNVYAPGQTTPMSTLQQIRGPVAVAMDSLGNIYVGFNGAINVYPVNVTTPGLTLGGAPISFAINANGDWAESDVGNFVPTYLYTNQTPFAAITNGIASPFGIAASH